MFWGNASLGLAETLPAGVIALTKTVAREYSGRNITANAVAPGFIASGKLELASCLLGAGAAEVWGLDEQSGGAPTTVGGVEE